MDFSKAIGVTALVGSLFIGGSMINDGYGRYKANEEKIEKSKIDYAGMVSSATNYVKSVKKGDDEKIERLVEIINGPEYTSARPRAIEALGNIGTKKAYNTLSSIMPPVFPRVFGKTIAKAGASRAIHNYVNVLKHGKDDAQHNYAETVAYALIEGARPLNEDSTYLVQKYSEFFRDSEAKCHDMLYAKALRKIDPEAANIRAPRFDILEEQRKNFTIDRNKYECPGPTADALRGLK